MKIQLNVGKVVVKESAKVLGINITPVGVSPITVEAPSFELENFGFAAEATSEELVQMMEAQVGQLEAVKDIMIDTVKEAIDLAAETTDKVIEEDLIDKAFAISQHMQDLEMADHMNGLTRARAINQLETEMGIIREEPKGKNYAKNKAKREAAKKAKRELAELKSNLAASKSNKELRPATKKFRERANRF